MYKNLLKNTSLLTLILGEKHGFNFIWKIILSFIWMSGSASHDRSLTIGSYVSMHSSRYEARGKFGEHERCIWVAWGIAESNSSFLSALQTSLVHHISMNAQLTYESIVLLHFQSNGKYFSQGICLLTSWACTKGIWSTLMQLNLIGQIY